MAVRTRRLFGPSVGVITGTNVYTVPPDRTARITTVRVVNGAAASLAFAYYLNAVAAANLLGGGNVGVGAVFLDLGVLVLHPGESLIYVATQAGCPISGHGALLAGAPA